MNEITNNTRASWANTALSAFAVETNQVNAGDDDATILHDLLCNFRHLADAQGWIIENIWEDARETYREEVGAQAKADASFAEWPASPCPVDPDNFWIDDATGERVNAATGERKPA